MRSADPALPDVFTRAEALAAGMSGQQVKRRPTTGAWRVLRRGVYCRTSTWDARSPEGRHLLEASAALAVVETPVWVSHASGAAAHDLPLPRGGSPVWLTRLPEHGTWYGRDLKIEAATLPLADQWTRRRLPVTSLPRTVADSARHCLPPDGLAIADAAFRRDPPAAERGARVLEACSEWPYAARGSRVLALASGRRESALESWSCWYMDQFAVPMPSWQVDIFDPDGRFLGRADAWWEQFGLIGEADGRTKYRVLDGDVGAAERALYEEKRREDRLREAGAGVARWGAVDLSRPDRWAEWLKWRLGRADRHAFRGHAVPAARPA